MLQLYMILPSKHFLVEPTEEPNLLLILNTAFQIIVSKTQLAQSLYFHVGFPIF